MWMCAGEKCRELKRENITVVKTEVKGFTTPFGAVFAAPTFMTTRHTPTTCYFNYCKRMIIKSIHDMVTIQNKEIYLQR